MVDKMPCCAPNSREGTVAVTCHLQCRLAGALRPPVLQLHLLPQPMPVTDTLQAWLQGAAASKRKVKSDAPPSASSRKVSAVLCVRLCSISLERLCCMPLSQHRGTSAILGRASKARQAELLHGLLYSLQPAKYLSARALWCRQRPRQPSRPFTPLVKRTEAALAV